MTRLTAKVICTNRHCDWHGLDSELLRAADPFTAGDELVACPKCRQTPYLSVACDEPDCWRPVTCGTPIVGGYRNTCGDHRPDASKDGGA